MIENEMLFLGLLLDGPKHDHEIKRTIDEEFLSFVGLKIKSSYYPRKKMEQLKLVRSIIPQGRKIFDHLITQSFLSVARPFFSLDLSLYFLPYVNKNLSYRKLRRRVIFLKRI